MTGKTGTSPLVEVQPVDLMMWTDDCQSGKKIKNEGLKETRIYDVKKQKKREIVEFLKEKKRMKKQKERRKKSKKNI